MQTIENNMLEYCMIAHGADRYNFEKNISNVLNDKAMVLLTNLSNKTSSLIFEKILAESKELKPSA